MSIRIFITGLVLMSFFILAQQDETAQKVKDLEAKINTEANASVKLDMYIDLLKLYENGSSLPQRPQKLIEIGTASQKLAKQVQQKEKAFYPALMVALGYIQDNQFEKASVLVKQLENEESKLGDHKHLIEVYQYSAWVCGLLHQVKDELRYMEMVIPLMLENEDYSLAVLYRYYLAHSYHHHLQTDLDKAMEYYQRCLKLYEKLNDIPGRVKVEVEMAWLLQDMKKEAEALAQYQRAVTLAEKNRDLFYIGYGNYYYGLLLLEQKNNHEAQKAFAKAKEGIKELIREEAAKKEPSMYYSLGYHYLSLISSEEGQLVKSAEYLAEAIRVCKEQDDWSLQASEMGWLGYTLTRQGSYDEAEKVLLEALALIHKRAESPDNKENLLHYFLGELYFARKQYDKAVTSYRAALDRLSKYVINRTQDYIKKCQNRLVEIEGINSSRQKR